MKEVMMIVGIVLLAVIVGAAVAFRLYGVITRTGLTSMKKH